MQSVVKGMVRVAGNSHRIVRAAPGKYDVARIPGERRAASACDPALAKTVLSAQIERKHTRGTIRSVGFQRLKNQLGWTLSPRLSAPAV